MIVMKLAGLPDGTSTPFDGDYLADFDFEANDGRGEITMAGFDISKAKLFNDMAAALHFYHRQPKNRPFREDGMRNRPLTSTNWSFEHFIRECDIYHKPGPLNDNSEEKS